MMVKSALQFLSLFLAALLAFPSTYAAEVKVFAAASLTDAMKEIAAAYETESGDKLVFNFAGSNVLARQIKEGAPADVFASADTAQMDAVAAAGLLANDTRANLLSNTLVIVVPKDAAALTPQQLATPAVKRIALADPRSVPAGVYAKEYLTRLDLWKAVEAKVVPTENVRAALAAVESANVEAGIVYKTDAAISKGAKIAFAVPAADGPEISYPVAVLKSAPDLAAAKKFVLWLRSEDGWKVFKKYGFLPAAK